MEHKEPGSVPDAPKSLRHPEVNLRNAEIYKIAHDLSDLEILEAKLEYAHRKYDRLKYSDYWKAKEAEKTGKAHF